jgi:hypothetical protein
MKKILAALISGLMLISFSPALGSDEEEIRQLTQPTSGGWIGIDFIETDYFATSLLTVGNDKTDSNYDQWRTVICDSAADAKCQIPGYYMDATSIFSPCSATITTNCIESLDATLPDGRVLNGTVKRLWNPQGEYKGDPLLGIPDGGQASTWVLYGSNPNGSDEYVLMAGVRGGIRVPQMTTQNNSNNDFRGRLFAFLQPVKTITGNYMDPKMVLYPRGNGGIGIGGGSANNLGCFMNDTTSCALRSAFPLDVKYTLKMRFDRPLNPWLTGRVVNPTIDYKDLGNQKSTLTISAFAMRTPVVGGFIKWSDTPDWMKAKYPAGTGGTGGSPDAFTTQNLDTRILRINGGSSGTRAIKEFKEWIPFLQDKPFAMKTFWNVLGIQDNPSQKMWDCAQDKFAGMVSSNAAVYSAGAPTWNAENQTLDYTVGAPHYDLDGKLLTGQYVLSMRSDVARCIYGFTSAPISARVEIASEDGNPNVATTVINENKVTGMLTLTASGFHYSVPQLSVKLMQEKAPVAAPTSTATPSPATKSITCIKGKLKKTVKGTSPKCPTGYKKA